MPAAFVRTLGDGRAGFPALLEAIEAHLEDGGVPPGPAAQVMIALDEVISNALDYGGETGAPTVDVAIGIDEGAVDVTISDDGKPFNPLAAPPPDTSLSIEDREIGGLGIHLVRELMDDVSYAREAGRNRLRFSKNFPLA